MIFYNPPVVNRQLGIRKGAIPITRAISGMLLKNGIQSITFARSRLTVEVLTRYLKDMVRDPLGNAGRVRGYRGGYLPGNAGKLNGDCGTVRWTRWFPPTRWSWESISAHWMPA